MTYAQNSDVTLVGTGTGGLAEFKSNLDNNQVYFGVLRVRAVDDHGSKRAKFVFVTYVGAGVVSHTFLFFSMIKYFIWNLDSNASCSCFNSKT